MGVSHVAGGAVRRVGASARDLEPEHRRDGVGFGLIALAIIVAAREWWGVRGVFGEAVHAVVAGTFGRIGYAVPLVLLLLGLRVLRSPEDEAATNRIIVGTVALTFAACGLAHLSDGIPNPPDGADGMRAAGGIIGFLASSPLDAAVSRYGALAILVLLGTFGLLVITATPVNQIPHRLRQLRALVLHRPLDGDSADPAEDAVGPGPAKRTRRKAVDLSERDGDEAFRQAATKGAEDEPALGLRPGEKRPTAPGVLAPRPAGSSGSTQAIDATDPRSLGAPDPSKVGPKPELVPPPTSPIPSRVEQLSLEGNVTYHLPDHALLAHGAPHKTRSHTNDKVVELSLIHI